MLSDRKFILTPLFESIEEAVIACRTLTQGIECQPVCEYLMQSLFLNACGAQEQKFRCIYWELVSDDYQLRYDLLHQGKSGEFSQLSDKQSVYNLLLKQINKHDSTFVISGIDKPAIIKFVKDEFTEIFKDSQLSSWYGRSFVEFREMISKLKEDNFAIGENLLPSHRVDKNNMDLNKPYVDHLWWHRNRCAHNTTSYQANYPSIKQLTKDGREYENYFLWLSILVIIDIVMMQLYNHYSMLYSEMY